MMIPPILYSAINACTVSIHFLYIYIYIDIFHVNLGIHTDCEKITEEMLKVYDGVSYICPPCKK